MIAIPVVFTVMFTYLLGGALAGSTCRYLQFVLPGTLVMAVLLSMYAGVGLATDRARGITAAPVPAGLAPGPGHRRPARRPPSALMAGHPAVGQLAWVPLASAALVAAFAPMTAYLYGRQR